MDVAGIGYRVVVGTATMARLSALPGSEVTLHTHLQVREDSLTLFGFATTVERDCFEALIGAHGVGPSLAMAILDVHDPVALGRVVAQGDVAALVLVPGVGRKTADRLLIELRSRLDGVIDAVDAVDAARATSSPGGVPAGRADVRAALEHLGYSYDEIARALALLPSDGSSAELLKAALKVLAEARV